VVSDGSAPAPLDSVVRCFSDGLWPETILGEFETLNLAEVYRAITYYLENRAEN
jgi:uncharacterized protein (DUF433 family)